MNTHLSDGNGWPQVVAEAARLAISGNNAERYDAALRIGGSGYRPAGPFLASLLDDREWDVRSAALQALKELCQDGFPDDDDAILRAAFEALGDENSLVAMRAAELIEAAGAPRRLLADVIALTGSSDPERILTGLRATVAAARIDDLEDAVKELFDGASLIHLLRSPVPAVRAAYLHALGAANMNLAPAWESGLHDDHPDVRARAVTALRLLEHPPPAPIVEPLLSDPAEDVRIEALFTLGQLGDFDRDRVREALDDPSEQVRHYAAVLLDQ